MEPSACKYCAGRQFGDKDLPWTDATRRQEESLLDPLPWSKAISVCWPLPSFLETFQSLTFQVTFGYLRHLCRQWMRCLQSGTAVWMRHEKGDPFTRNTQPTFLSISLLSNLSRVLAFDDSMHKVAIHNRRSISVPPESALLWLVGLVAETVVRIFIEVIPAYSRANFGRTFNNHWNAHLYGLTATRSDLPADDVTDISYLTCNLGLPFLDPLSGTKLRNFDSTNQSVESVATNARFWLPQDIRIRLSEGTFRKHGGSSPSGCTPKSDGRSESSEPTTGRGVPDFGNGSPPGNGAQDTGQKKGHGRKGSGNNGSSPGSGKGGVDDAGRSDKSGIWSCPFRKRNPSRFNPISFHVCATTQWKEFSLLK